MKPSIKNIEFASVLPVAELTSYLPGQVVSKTLAQNSAVSLTLFAFDQGEEISTHASKGDAMIVAVDGTGEITIDDETYTVQAGESIVMPANHPHSVYAPQRFKMFLIVVFPQEENT